MKYEIIDSKTGEPTGAAFQTASEAAEFLSLVKGCGYAYRQSSERLDSSETYNANLLLQGVGVAG